MYKFKMELSSPIMIDILALDLTTSYILRSGVTVTKRNKEQTVFWLLIQWEQFLGETYGY